MRTNGTIVYRISIGMLYRTCGGSLSPRLRWKIAAQRISPHTTHPTSSPAIHDPCQRLSVILPCSVTGSGKPRRVNVLFVHPVRASSMTASAPTRTAFARRRGRVLREAVPRVRGAAWRRISVNEAPSQQRRPVPRPGARPESSTACRGNSIARPRGAASDPRRCASWRPFATDSDWLASWRVLTRNTARTGHYGSREGDPMSWLRRDQRADGQQAVAPGPVSQPLLTIDALGRKCPIPIIMLAEQIRDVPVGAVIAVLADDPAAYNDVPAWCGMKSHELVFRSELDSGWAFGIRRRY